MSKLPELKDIELNRWYVCLIGQSEELCKVRRIPVLQYTVNNIEIHPYQVVCYYTGKMLFSGCLTECQKFIREHILLKR